MTKFISSLAFKLIAAGVVVLILLVSVKSCTGARQKAAQSQQDARGAKASAETAKDVVGTVLDRADSNATLDELVIEVQKELANAPDVKVSRAATVAAICRVPDVSKPAGC